MVSSTSFRGCAEGSRRIRFSFLSYFGIAPERSTGSARKHRDRFGSKGQQRIPLLPCSVQDRPRVSVSYAGLDAFCDVRRHRQGTIWIAGRGRAHNVDVVFAVEKREFQCIEKEVFVSTCD